MIALTDLTFWSLSAKFDDAQHPSGPGLNAINLQMTAFDVNAMFAQKLLEYNHDSEQPVTVCYNTLNLGTSIAFVGRRESEQLQDNQKWTCN